VHVIGSKPGRVRKFSRGQSFAEFGLVAIPCVMILFFITAFGYALYTYNFVSDAARDAVRYAIVHGSHSLNPASETDITNFVKKELHGLSAKQISVATCWNAQSGSCPDPSGGNNNPGKVVSVTVTYNFRPLYPMPDVTLPLTSSSQMVISY
jgi:Flp pilus assembly protein TadG